MTRPLQQIAVLHDLFNQINERLSIIGETTDAYFLCQCIEILKQQGKTIDTQAAEVEALRKDASWQPIETAPKDDVVLGFVPHQNEKSGYVCPIIRTKENAWVNTSCPNFCEEKPILWMPLPMPPTAIAKDTQE
jgi:hypothetical protein